MNLLKLIANLQGFAETVDNPEEAEVRVASDPESDLEIISIYEGEPGMIWMDVEQEG